MRAAKAILGKSRGKKTIIIGQVKRFETPPSYDDELVFGPQGDRQRVSSTDHVFDGLGHVMHSMRYCSEDHSYIVEHQWFHRAHDFTLDISL